MRLVSLSVLSLLLLCCTAGHVANKNLGRDIDEVMLAVDPRRDHRQQRIRESECRHPCQDKDDALGSESRRRTISLERSSEMNGQSTRRRHLRSAEEAKDETPFEDATVWEKLIEDSGGSMTVPTAAPASVPSKAPVLVTRNPTEGPTSAPTLAPIVTPTGTPTSTPSASPTQAPSPASYVARLIRSVALNGGDEFSNPDSYQSEALSWLESSSIEGLNDERIIQRYSLGCIYFATNQVRTIYTDERFGEDQVPPWQSSANWITDANECEWARITCDDSNLVTTVDLFSNVVTGEFPPEVVYMNRTLQILDVGNNVVYSNGTTFNSYLGWLYQLTDLRTDRTNFESSNGIPVELANLKKLSYYTCESSLYRGPLNGDAFPSDLTELSVLDIEGNRYGSTIPDAIGLLPALQNFYIRSSEVSGTIDFMVNMTSIRQVFVDLNPGLASTIPTGLGRLSTLAIFSGTGCSFTGTLPDELANLGNNIQSMYFGNNSLTGSIPTAWGGLSSLEDLEIQLNAFNGEIPSEVCALTSSALSTLVADCVICPDSTCCTQCIE